QPPKIEFRCELYPIKVIVAANEWFSDLCVVITQRHAPFLYFEALFVRYSCNVLFFSVQVLITPTDVDHLQAIHIVLRAPVRVHI
ncbi:DUF493 family protein, partial [Pseudomonas aeruginosa]